MSEKTEVLACYQCGNRAPQRLIATLAGQELYEHIDGTRYPEKFAYSVHQCMTCDGLSFFGDFVEFPRHSTLSHRRLYPQGSQLLPEAHKLARKDCVPDRILAIYEEIWPLRHIAPNAFAGQIRRALELICRDQEAKGKTLFEQLKNLTSKGIFPGYFAEMTDLMRLVGNLGAHASAEEVDFWDAELLDDFFRSVIEYVYIAPSKIERLRQRLDTRGTREG